MSMKIASHRIASQHSAHARARASIQYKTDRNLMNMRFGVSGDRKQRGRASSTQCTHALVRFG